MAQMPTRFSGWGELQANNPIMYPYNQIGFMFINLNCK